MSKKTSVIWTIEKEKLQDVVSRSKSFADIFRYFGLVIYGSGYKTLKKRMDGDGIDYSHIPLGFNCNRGRKFDKTRAIPLEKIMVENSTYSRGSLKKRLIKLGILKNECSVCGRPPIWENKVLILVIDHINGVNNDNRIKNLRLVCPNCNSQLDTSGGKNRRKKINCLGCGRIIWKTSSYCRICRPRSSYFRKVPLVDRPSKEELGYLIGNVSMVKIGKKYGVSDNTIRKWCKDLGVN